MKSCCLQRGVTLVELLVALLIVAILAVIAVPYLGHYLAMRRLEGAAQAIYSDLSSAQKYAIAKQQTVRVVYQTGTNWCLGITTASTCDCNTDAACDLGQTTASIYNSVSLTSSGFSSGTISYSSSRGAVSSSGTFNLSVGSDTISVELNQMGVARLCANNGMGGLNPC